MQITLPLVLIALGGATIVTQRHGWLALGGFAAQWIGLLAAMNALAAAPNSASAALSVEGATALVCVVLLAIALWSPGSAPSARVASTKPAATATSRTKKSTGRTVIIEKAEEVPLEVPPRRSLNITMASLSDQLWLWAVVILGGVAGFGLATIYPFRVQGQHMLAFYWIVLTGALTLVIDGARVPVKLAIGLLVLLNGASVIVYTLSVTQPGVATLGLLALSRAGLAGLLAYGLALLKTEFPTLSMGALFDSREGKRETETALAVADTNRDTRIEAGAGRPGTHE